MWKVYLPVLNNNPNELIEFSTINYKIAVTQSNENTNTQITENTIQRIKDTKFETI